MNSNSDPSSSSQYSYFDDSSSEEDDKYDIRTTRTSKSVDQYDVIDQFKKFCELQELVTAEQSDKYKNAFYSHALGIQIMRHPTVMKYYSEDKKKYLNYGLTDEDGNVLSDEVVNNWIAENINLTLETGYFCLPGNNNSDASKELTRQFLSTSNNSVAIEKLIKSLTADKNRLFSLLNRRRSSDNYDVQFSSLLPTYGINSMVSNLDYQSTVLPVIKYEDFEINEVMKEEKFEKLRNIIKDGLKDELKICMDTLKKEHTKEGRIPGAKNKKQRAIFSLSRLPNCLTAEAAIDTYLQILGATSPNSFQQLVIPVALENTLQKIRNEILNVKYDKLVKALISNTVKKSVKDCMECFTVDDENNVVAIDEENKKKTIDKLNNINDDGVYYQVKNAALKCYNSLGEADTTTTTTFETLATNIKNEAIASILSLFTDKEGRDKLELYHDELLVSGLLTPTTVDDVKVIIQRNFDNEHDKFLNSLLDNLGSSRSALFKEHGIERVILSPGHQFDLSMREKDFFPRFLATLNLCNRSSRRYLRNLYDDELKRLTDKVHSRSWKFSQSPKWPVFDNHKFTTKGKRKDETLELGGYKAVYNLIEEIKNNLNEYVVDTYLAVNDKDIASWIRGISSGTSIVQNGALTRKNGAEITINKYMNLTDKMIAQLIKITYLLFGSEVMRNPASLIHHQMMIDLILDGQMTWKNALNKDDLSDDGGEMPMSMKKAVSSARILHKKFLPFMSHPYYYDPLHDTAATREEDLLVRENTIYEKWFTDYQCIKEVLEEEEDTDVRRLEALSYAVTEWYGKGFELKQLNERLAQCDSAMDSLLIH